MKKSLFLSILTALFISTPLLGVSDPTISTNYTKSILIMLNNLDKHLLRIDPNYKVNSRLTNFTSVYKQHQCIVQNLENENINLNITPFQYWQLKNIYKRIIASNSVDKDNLSEFDSLFYKIYKKLEDNTTIRSSFNECGRFTPAQFRETAIRK